MNNNAFIDNNRANFSHLIVRVKDPEDQNKYVNQWRKKYVKSFKDSEATERFIWDIKVHKSLKEVFTSVAFYQESLVAKESNSLSAYYFLSYYSLFHALLSCVVLIPDQSIKMLSEITHSKLIKLFKSTFCDNKPYIILNKIESLYTQLKYQREYYSYNLPPNDLFINEDVKPEEALPLYIRSCMQLASLHSEIIESCSWKHGKDLGNHLQYRKQVTEWYEELNCPKHPRTEKYVLDYTDKVKIEEILKYARPTAFLTEYEHFVDEFRSYGDTRQPHFANGEPINPASFVYRNLFR